MNTKIFRLVFFVHVMYCHIFYSISSVVLKVWFVDQEHHITWKLVRNAVSQAPAQPY